MANKKVGAQERTFEAHGRDNASINTHMRYHPPFQVSPPPLFSLGEYYENFYIKKL
jgi:hypothetical protein